MARPTESTDEQLLAAAEKVLMTEGPSTFTLAKAAAEAGVSAATLVKRFGSKDTLFTRLSQRWAGSLDERLRECAEPHESPLERFRAVALHSYAALDHAESAAIQLAALAVDLQHDERRRLLDVGWSHVRRHLEVHAAGAVAAGELVDATPPEALARLTQGAMEGNALAWSVRPHGSLVQRLGDDLDVLLAAWRRD